METNLIDNWYWPLTISLLRLSVILLLLMINALTVTRLLKRRGEKYKETQLSLVIAWNSIIYLLLVWMPFTFGTLSHDLDDFSKQRFHSVEHNNIPVPSHDSSSTINIADDYIAEIKGLNTHESFDIEFVDLKSTVDHSPDDLNGKESEPEFILEYIDIADGKVVESASHRRKRSYVHPNDYPVDTSERYRTFVRPPVPPPFVRTEKSSDLRSSDSEESTVSPCSNSEESSVSPSSNSEEFTVSPPSNSEESTNNKEDSESVSTNKVDSAESTSSSITTNVSLNKDERDMYTSLSTVGQDFMTSLCVYLLSVVAIIKICLRKTYVGNPFPWFIAYLGVPFFIPMLVLYISRTLFWGSAEFAPHKPEYTPAGYFLYNLICDVKITIPYAIDVNVEWSVIVVLVLAALPLLKRFVESYLPRNELERNLETQVYSTAFASSHATESWARDVSLAIALLWTSLVKPSMILILFFLYGEHWTNSVCWVAHVAIAIPVVFLPLSVFLSGLKNEHQPVDLSIYKEIQRQVRLKTKQGNPDAERSDNPDGKKPENANVKTSTKPDSKNINIPCDKEKETSGEQKEPMQNRHPEDIEKGQEPTDDDFKRIPANKTTLTEGKLARENLKFYLGKDIFKFGTKPSEKPSDKQLILDSEWDDANASEA